MLLYGMDSNETEILSKWATRFPLKDIIPERHLVQWRRIWLEAGGKLPITEADALFLKPKKEHLQCM